jgi:flagellar hook-associated protein 1 FlgK
MGASALMSLGTRAMAASYAALQATGHNISNANTAGYSRQSVELATSGGQFTGAGFFGKGVDVSSVERSHNEFLTREAANTRAVAAGDTARSDQLNQLEKVFQLGEAGIGNAAGQLLNAFVDVANKPQDGSARQVVLSQASELAARVNDAGKQFDVLQAGVTADLKSAVAAVNTLTGQIARLNGQIAAVKGSGHSPNDLLDQRDQAVNDLSQYLQVSTVAADDGSLSLFIGGGQKLVLSSNATPLVALQDKFDPSKVQIGISDSGMQRPLADDVLSAGSISGLLRFQNSDLPDARNQLGQMVTALAGKLNDQQALGLDLGRPARSGAPLMSVGLPSVLPSTANAQTGGIPDASYIDANGVRVPSVALTIVKPEELQASDYQLYADPASGSYELTRMSDGKKQTVVDGDVVDGFRVNIAWPPPSPRDTFLLQPVASAARNMVRALDDPQGIAAASPVTGTVGIDNKGTATVASLRAVSTAIDPTLHTAIQFTDNTGSYDWQLLDASNNLVNNGNGVWTAGQPIQLSGWQMELNGVPKTGDTLAVQKTLNPAGDNGNANALLSLRDAAIVGQQTLPDGTVVPGATVTDAYANVLASVGVRVGSAQTLADQSNSAATSAQTAQSNSAGVNLDEEAARLIQYQQSYQAAAKMLQVAQSVFDTLLTTMGGH